MGEKNKSLLRQQGSQPNLQSLLCPTAHFFCVLSSLWHVVFYTFYIIFYTRHGYVYTLLPFFYTFIMNAIHVCSIFYSLLYVFSTVLECLFKHLYTDSYTLFDLPPLWCHFYKQSNKHTHTHILDASYFYYHLISYIKLFWPIQYNFCIISFNCYSDDLCNILLMGPLRCKHKCSYLYIMRYTCCSYCV